MKDMSEEKDKVTDCERKASSIMEKYVQCHGGKCTTKGGMRVWCDYCEPAHKAISSALSEAEKRLSQAEAELAQTIKVGNQLNICERQRCM